MAAGLYFGGYFIYIRISSSIGKSIGGIIFEVLKATIGILWIIIVMRYWFKKYVKK